MKASCSDSPSSRASVIERLPAANASVRSRDWRGYYSDADAAVVTSYCPDGPAASTLVCDAARPFKIFYDLDTPVTLEIYGRPLWEAAQTISRKTGAPWNPLEG